MGTWGTSLYANDSTNDVKDCYKKFLQDMLSDEEAYQKTMELFHEYIGDDEEPLFWYALADTQWRLGRLMPDVKEKALNWIENAGGLDIWEESKSDSRGWKKTLDKLKDQLNSPMPNRRIFKSPAEFIRNPWNIGDIYAYQFYSEMSKEHGLYGKYIPFQKIADEEWYDGWILSRVQIYDKVFDELPTLFDLEGIRILPFDKPERFFPNGYNDDFPLHLNAVMIRYTNKEYPEKNYHLLVISKIKQQCLVHMPINLHIIGRIWNNNGFACTIRLGASISMRIEKEDCTLV